MATSYQSIIDAIDAAVLAQAAYPARLTSPDGSAIEYRLMGDWIKTREYYAGLLAAQTKGGGKRFGIRLIQAGGIQSCK